MGSITAKFIDPSYTPNANDEKALEDCFHKGILSCSDVPGQSCPVHPDCKDDWGCMKSKDWFNCGPKDNGRCASKSAGKCSCHKGDGSLLRDRVKLPDNFVSKHTLIGFRWDCEDTPQLWVQCAASSSSGHIQYSTSTVHFFTEAFTWSLGLQGFQPLSSIPCCTMHV